ncbi:hypothetical protein [Streptomyces scabiei]|uniref:hypothetical protein n=1 Tax=Streptomyces scabiei TaxID=1930 RepID=UPI0029C0C4DC|nr:hypothetical protein [Streptomyces scabiei]
MADRPHNSRRTLVTYALALGYVVIVAAGLILTLQDHSLTSGTIMSALGLNLVASAVFALLFASISSRIQERAFMESVADKFDDLSTLLTERMSERERIFLPSGSYLPSEGFDELFNRDLTDSLTGTSFYGFKGPSPRYLPGRLRMSPRHPHLVRVCMLDPSLEKSVSRRASDRGNRRNLGINPVPQLVDELRDELLMSVVALFDCRHFCPIEISYMEDTAVYRVELFDDSAYVSWYHGPESSGRKFPESYKFPPGSLQYETMKMDLNRRSEICDKSIVFNSRHVDADLIAHLHRLTDRTVDGTDLAAWRSQYEIFIARFIGYLDGLRN